MKLQQMKIVLATVWVLSVIAVLMAFADVMSTTNRFALAMLGVLPPVAMWLWWHEPSQTISESIHGVRDEGRGEHPGLAKPRPMAETPDEAALAVAVGAMADEGGPQRDSSNRARPSV
jgi:hypothetical protein